MEPGLRAGWSVAAEPAAAVPCSAAVPPGAALLQGAKAVRCPELEGVRDRRRQDQVECGVEAARVSRARKDCRAHFWLLSFKQHKSFCGTDAERRSSDQKLLLVFAGRMAFRLHCVHPHVLGVAGTAGSKSSAKREGMFWLG